MCMVPTITVLVHHVACSLHNPSEKYIGRLMPPTLMVFGASDVLQTQFPL